MITLFRRRREKKTDYQKRLALVRAGIPRLVVRRFHNNTTVQVIAYAPAGDRTLVESTVRDLRRLGWSHHGGNTPSAYLVGYLTGTRAFAKGIKEVVLDLGVQRSVKGSSLYAAAYGVKEAGVNVPLGGDVVPPETRLKGEHIGQMRQSTIVHDVDVLRSKIAAETVVA